jgi:hypothetical protein
MEYIQQEKSHRDLILMSYNKKFMLKPIRNRQHRAFIKHMVQRYHAKVSDDSYLQHLYGLFKLTILGKQYRLALIDNPFKNLSAPVIWKLKWSEIQREGDQDELTIVLQNFERVSGASITLYPRDITKLHDTLVDDLNFMKQSHIEDFTISLAYSENELDRNIRNRFYGSLNGDARIFAISISEFLNRTTEHRARCCRRRARVGEEEIDQEMN